MRKDKRKKIIKNAIIVAILFVLVLSYLYIEGIRDVVNLVVISFKAYKRLYCGKV